MAIQQITNNDTFDAAPQVSGNNIVWSGDDGNDREIYFYNGSQTIQLTNNQNLRNDTICGVMSKPRSPS